MNIAWIMCFLNILKYLQQKRILAGFDHCGINHTVIFLESVKEKNILSKFRMILFLFLVFIKM